MGPIFIVFGKTRPGFEPQTFQSQGGHSTTRPLSRSGYSSIAFNIVPKSCRRYYTVITKITLHPGEVSGPCVGLPVLYSTVMYCTVLYCAILYFTVLYLTVLYCTVLYCTVPYCTILYLTVLYLTVLYFTQLYLTVGYWTIRYCTVPYSSEGLPSSHVASLVSLGPCTVLYCTLLYSTVPNVLYYTAVLDGLLNPMLHDHIKSRENLCCGFSITVDFISCDGSHAQTN